MSRTRNFWQKGLYSSLYGIFKGTIDGKTDQSIHFAPTVMGSALMFNQFTQLNNHNGKVVLFVFCFFFSNTVEVKPPITQPTHLILFFPAFDQGSWHRNVSHSSTTRPLCLHFLILVFSLPFCLFVLVVCRHCFLWMFFVFFMLCWFQSLLCYLLVFVD